MDAKLEFGVDVQGPADMMNGGETDETGLTRPNPRLEAYITPFLKSVTWSNH